ncbi:helix-turn-helix domain-containing protein [Streptomyces longispororuber]|uniref:helix-turn-helix domain-containing protein n=1 Tax=Streptomyces longispororuber TaxID=68230 RepID=UPI00210BEC6D|nr:XRE family transcriptional regulator [Streptomyces longispororuber]MCQ4207697.1 XRE family transcriptional regulator [Streptomyces longispororuber]
MATIGSRLRTLRRAKGLSLRALAAAVGVSPTLLSQVERGVTEPSLSTLRRLADVHAVSVADLFSPDEKLPTEVSRPGERPVLRSPRGTVLYERVTPSNGTLEVLRAVLEPGDVSSDEPWSHSSVECAYVVTGTLTADIDGSTRTVRAGEAITFDAGIPHRYLNEARETVEFVIATSPPA